MGEIIKLSEYDEKLHEGYRKSFQENCNKIMTWLNKKIGKDLFELAKTQNPIEAYKRIIGWLFKFYPNELREAFESNGFSFKDCERLLLSSFVITFSRDEKRASALYDSLKENNLVNGFNLDDEKFRLSTTDYGVITFYFIQNYLDKNPYLKNKCMSMGNRIKDGCHEISEYMIEHDDSLVALSGISEKPLDEKFAHSLILDGDMIVDIPNGIIMSQDDYFKINDFKIITKYNYNELKDKNAKCKEYDESRSLFPLLRCMLYEMCERENEREDGGEK